MIPRALATLVALLACSACVTPAAPPPTQPPPVAAIASSGGPQIPAQTLGTNDVFEVRVVGEPDLTGTYRVSSEGAISFPFCGRLEVAGQTANQISGRLTACLADGYLKSPQVTVFIKEYNSKKVFVFGEVQKAGTFAYEDNMTVIEAITLAGGFTKVAARNSVLVTRSVGGKEEKLKLAVDDIGTGKRENFRLQPGDIVYIPESFF